MRKDLGSRDCDRRAGILNVERVLITKLEEVTGFVGWVAADDAEGEAYYVAFDSKRSIRSDISSHSASWSSTLVF